MAQVDERDAQALEELRKIESKIVNYRTRMKLISQQIGAAINTQKRASLVKDELKLLSSDTRTFGALGRAYVLVPKEVLEDEQKDKIDSSSSEVTRLKETLQKLERSAKEFETEFRELVNQHPALLQS